LIDLGPAAAALARAKRVLLTCHLGPDGDSIGSLSALAALLREDGREVVFYNPDPAPRNLKWLPHVDTLVHKLPPGTFDATIVVDCGDRKLLGKSFPDAATTGPLVVLDHHASSRPFGDVYACDPDAASVGVLVARLAGALGLPLSPRAAPGLYVSLVSDTGSFRYANTNAEAFELAGLLVAELGVSPWQVAQALGEEVPLVRWRLLAQVLAGIALEVGGKIAVMVITDEMVRGVGARWEHTEGIVNYARAIEGVECGVLLTPARDGGVRVSLRSKGNIDAGAVCAPFGGGGHPGAAGCLLEGTIEDARARIVAALAAALA
jgi:phosphoesterase RecJ-like protein